MSINLLKTDGVWSADKFNLRLKRTVALKNFKKLFGADGIACKNATLGVSVIWTSPDSRQRGSKPIMEIHAPAEMSSETQDHSFLEGELEIEFPRARLRGEIDFSIVLYISKAGTPAEDENHLANEEGFVLGEFDSFILKIDGNGSLFPVFEVYEQDQPLWYVRCDWTDPVSDLFSETVSININKAHKNYKYIDRTQKTFCSQLLVEVMSSALCCIIEKYVLINISIRYLVMKNWNEALLVKPFVILPIRSDGIVHHRTSFRSVRGNSLMGGSRDNGDKTIKPW